MELRSALYSRAPSLSDDRPTIAQVNDLREFSTGALVASLWFSLWLLRGRHDYTRRLDLYLFVAAIAWHAREHVGALVSPLSELLGTKYLPVGILLSLFLAIPALLLGNQFREASAPSRGKTPWLLPSRTSHTRLFPKKHSFAYSYLQVAVPVSSQGRFGSLISIGKVKRQGWFHVQASDYLERNSSEEDIKAKLRTYLRSQGVVDNSWSHAYLITAPRFLGYSFNPVSFWYIYDSEDTLAMMILEVNNTFDERRIYLLHAKSPDDKSEDSHSDSTEPMETLVDDIKPPMTTDESASVNGTVKAKFRNAWTKDFHVSPFSSRKGYYVLTAKDPFHGLHEAQPPAFNNCITLKSSKDHIKLVASVYSDGKALNPLTSSWWEMSSFVASWFWVGFLSFPRILKEAAVLFWAKGLHVWLRPEVMPTSIARREELIETGVAPFFESYLKALIAHHSKPIRVSYTSNLSGSLPQIFTNIPNDIDNDLQNTPTDLEIRVLSPVFFARFVHYSHTIEAFDRECVFTDEKNRTVWLSRPDLLYELIKSEIPISSNGVPKENLSWKIHKLLRCPPASPVYPFSADRTRIEDIRGNRLSPLDRYVMATRSEEAWMYRRLCARLFLAQRFAFGFVQIIDLIDFLIRVALVWAGTPSILHSDASLVASLLWISGVHGWAWVKGL